MQRCLHHPVPIYSRERLRVPVGARNLEKKLIDKTIFQFGKAWNFRPVVAPKTSQTSQKILNFLPKKAFEIHPYLQQKTFLQILTKIHIKSSSSIVISVVAASQRRYTALLLHDYTGYRTSPHLTPSSHVPTIPGCLAACPDPGAHAQFRNTSHGSHHVSQLAVPTVLAGLPCQYYCLQSNIFHVPSHLSSQSSSSVFSQHIKSFQLQVIQVKSKVKVQSFQSAGKIKLKMLQNFNQSKLQF